MTPQLLQSIRSRDFLKSQEDNFAKTAAWPSRLVWGQHAGAVPLFTIVLPTYKKPQFFRYALQSAVWQLPAAEYEILVLDDEPDDGVPNETQRIVEEMACSRVVYYRNTRNLGIFGNWNRCFELARSRWVIMLHDDDLLSPDFVSWMAAAVKRVPDAGLISTLWDSKARPPEQLQAGREGWQAAAETGSAALRRMGLWKLLLGTAITWQGSCISRDAYRAIGGLHLGDRKLGGEPIGGLYTEDYTTMVRLMSRFPVYVLYRPLYGFMEGLGDTSASSRVEEWGDALVLQYYCAQQMIQNAVPLALRPAARGAVRETLLRTARRYNQGKGYFEGFTNIDEDWLCEQCGFVRGSWPAALRIWNGYVQGRHFWAHLHQKTVALPPQ